MSMAAGLLTFAGGALTDPPVKPVELTYILLIAAAVLAVLTLLLYGSLRRQRRSAAPLSGDYLRTESGRFLRRENLVGSFRIDLTEDTCHGGSKPFSGFPSSRYDGPVDPLVERMSRLVHPSMQEAFLAQLRRQGLLYAFESDTSSVRGDYLFRLEDRGYVWLQLRVELMRDPQSGHIQALGYALDINRLKRLEEIGQKLITDDFTRMGLLDAESGHYLPFRTGHELAGVVPEDAPFRSYENEMLPDIASLMYPREYQDLAPQLRLSYVRQMLDERGAYDVTFRTVPQEDRPMRYLRIRYRYLSELHESIVVTSQDISALVATQLDPVTGIYNSHGFYQRVAEWLRDNPGRPYRLLFLDFDDFRYINAAYGYQAGVDILQDMGLYLHEHDTPDCFSGHLNADQFVRFAAADSLTAEQSYALFLKRYRRYKLNYPLQMHIGVYDLCEPDCDAHAMTYKAQLAQLSIRGDLSRHIAYYRPDMAAENQQVHVLLSDVRTALRDGQFHVWFQPQFDYAAGTLIGMEALARWQHPTRGMISPAEFIPLLERSNLISRLDRIMWEQACQWLKRWQDMGYPVSASVNVSRQDLQLPDLCGVFTGLLKRYGLKPQQFHLEITESVCAENTELMAMQAARLREAGFVVEMDDFGAGYSSLNTLKDIPTDVLKLDMKFLSDYKDDDRSRTILSSMVWMAHALQMKVIAEGVETAQQADALRRIGCRRMQGYFFAKPMPPEELEKLLATAQFPFVHED